jgi:hypothetical protein
METATCMFNSAGSGVAATPSHGGTRLNLVIRCLGQDPSVEDEAYNILTRMLHARNDGFLRKHHTRILDPVDGKIKCPVTYVRTNIDSVVLDSAFPEKAKHKHHIRFRWEARKIRDRLPDDTYTTTSCGVMVLLFSIQGDEEAHALDQEEPLEYDGGEEEELAPECEAEQLEKMLLEQQRAHETELARHQKLVKAQAGFISKLTLRNCKLRKRNEGEQIGLTNARHRIRGINEALAAAHAAHAAANAPPSPPPSYNCPSPDSKGRFEAKRVLAVRKSPVKAGKEEALVDWEGYPPSANSWEPAGKSGIAPLVRKFKEAAGSAPAAKRARK